jgi:hypothetical protein
LPISPESLYALLLDLEGADPLDFGGLPLSEDEARRLVCAGMSRLSHDLHAQSLSPDAIEAMALAVAARTVLENLVLHHERLTRMDGQPIAVQDWLAGLGGRR